MRDFKYKVTKEDEESQLPIRDLLRREFNFSSRLRGKIKKNKSCFLNEKSIPWWIVPKEHDEITVKLPEEKSHFPPQSVPIIPVFEDKDLLIINKPAGYVVHPTKGHPDYTIANGIAQYMIDTNQSFKTRFINRLDMDTSGLLALGKNSHAQDDFVKQMKENKVHKGYIAVVKGIFEENEGTIDLPIGNPNPGVPSRQVMKDGYPSITHYKVLERYKKEYTLLELRLETGRTHQIRVHLSHIGHPIVGDYLYGGENIALIERQALHAKYLSFYHPVTKKFIETTAPLPEDINELISKIK